MSFSAWFWFWADFVILGWICNSGLILSFWAEFVIMDWSGHFRLNCSRYSVLCFSVDFVIMDWIPKIGLKARFLILGSFAHWDVFVIRRLWHPGLNFSLWDDFVILGWIYHSARNFSSGLNLSFQAEFVIPGRFVIPGVCQSGIRLSFWADFYILGWICCSRLECSFLLECLCWIGHCDHKLSFWTEFVTVGW